MASVEENIEVDAPLERVYRAWTDYERFPRFMANVKEVRRVGPDLTHWVVETAGRTVEWEARTIEEARRRVRWLAQGGSGQSGEVVFTPLDRDRTRIDVRFQYHLPSKVEEATADALGIDDRAVQRDLQRFREMIEGDGPAPG